MKWWHWLALLGGGAIIGVSLYNKSPYLALSASKKQVSVMTEEFTLTATIINGIGPYTVEFHETTSLGGYYNVISTVSTQVVLGEVGTHIIQATATDTNGNVLTAEITIIGVSF